MCVLSREKSGLTEIIRVQLKEIMRVEVVKKGAFNWRERRVLRRKLG